MSINDATNVASLAAASSSSSVKKVTKTLANNIIGRSFIQLRRKPYKCYYAKSYDQLPNDSLCEFSPDLIAYSSGPDNGINDISLFSYKRMQIKAEDQLQINQKQAQSSTTALTVADPPQADLNTKNNENINTTNLVNNIQSTLIDDLKSKPVIEQQPKIVIKSEEATQTTSSTDVAKSPNSPSCSSADSSLSSDPSPTPPPPQPTVVVAEQPEVPLVSSAVPILSKKITPAETIQHPVLPLQKISAAPSLIKQTHKLEKSNTINTPSSVVSPERTLLTECCDSFIKAGITKWNLRHHRSYGIACSLYECNPVTNSTVGDPIADTYAILTRRNNSIMLLADGVNWGPRSRLAARCAVRAAMNHLNRNIFFPNQDYPNGHMNNLSNGSFGQKYMKTHDLFRIMMRSFDAAQEFILQKKGTMTTLCCSVVCKLKDTASSLWVVCTLSIGDSTAYVYNKDKGVFELTYGARNLNNDRDMRNVGGALGYVYGNKPDVSNLNYSLMYIRENDIVFLVSDGVSDNLDPCVSQTATRRKPESESSFGNSTEKLNERENSENHGHRHKGSLVTLTNYSNNLNTKRIDPIAGRKSMSAQDDQSRQSSPLPQLSPYERYVCSLSHMNEILIRNRTLNDMISAQETCAIFIDHVLKLTANKRDTLEKGLLEASKLTNEEEKSKFQAALRERVQKLRGKLDHASIVAYEVGMFS